MAGRSRPWEEVTREELMAYIGMLFYMGIVRLPQIEMYWSDKHELIRQHISEVMPLVRFQQISRFLHLNDNEREVKAGVTGYDPLYKVRPLLDIIASTFESEYNLNESITIDEAMIPFKGRLSFKQYMKDKPVKHGIKVFVLADAKYGYIKKFRIYTGKNSALSQDELGLSTAVVLDLMKGLEGRHHKLYVDNYYTSPYLFLTLYLKGTYACGTARTNRKAYPPALAYEKSKANEPKRGFYNYRSNGPLMACVWKDKRAVNFLTTIHHATSDASVTKYKQKENCPPCLPDYQEFMGGVDLSDQRMAYYNVGRRSRKWWKKIFSYILEACSQNAYVLKIYGQGDKKEKKPSFLNFRLELASELIGDYRKGSKSGRPRSKTPVDGRSDKNITHLPFVADDQRPCVYCRERTKFRCSSCNVALCLKNERNCYKEYNHTP